MYKVDIANSGGYSFKVKSGEYEFTVDTQGKGINPPDTLLASLGTCIGVYIRKYAQGLKLEFPAFRIAVSADLSKEAPFCFAKINVRILLEGPELDERRKKALEEFVKNCPVHNTLKTNPRIDIEVD